MLVFGLHMTKKVDHLDESSLQTQSNILTFKYQITQFDNSFKNGVFVPTRFIIYKIAAYIWRSYLLSLVTYQTQVNRINLGKWKPVPGFLYVGVVKESILAFSCHRQSCWVWRHVCNMHAHTHAFFLTRNPPYNVQTMIAKTYW